MIYHPLVKKDTLIILQGLMLFLAIIFTGVGVAQYQLANLTQKNELMAAVALKWEKSGYVGYLKEAEKHLAATSSKAEQMPEEALFNFKAILAQLNFSEKIEDLKNAVPEIDPELKLIYKELQKDAYAGKKYLEEKLKNLRQSWSGTSRQK
ncbi:MAG: hypothetical protein LBR56_09580 [Sporomusaceae bacterium]|nr:hypothetical protein [Sporomusaceae bacterium]